MTHERSDTKPLADAVVKRREDLGWSRTYLAERAGISYAAVKKVEEGGAPTWETLQGLSKAFSLSISALTAGVPRIPDEDPKIVQQVQGLIAAVERGTLSAEMCIEILRDIGYLERRPVIVRRFED